MARVRRVSYNDINWPLFFKLNVLKLPELIVVVDADGVGQPEHGSHGDVHGSRNNGAPQHLLQLFGGRTKLTAAYQTI